MNRRNFIQGLSAVLGAFALPWKGEAKEPPTKLGGPSSMWVVDIDEPKESMPVMSYAQGTDGKWFRVKSTAAGSDAKITIEYLR